MSAVNTRRHNKKYCVGYKVRCQIHVHKAILACFLMLNGVITLNSTHRYSKPLPSCRWNSSEVLYKKNVIWVVPVAVTLKPHLIASPHTYWAACCFWSIQELQPYNPACSPSWPHQLHDDISKQRSSSNYLSPNRNQSRLTSINPSNPSAAPCSSFRKHACGKGLLLHFFHSCFRKSKNWFINAKFSCCE